MGKRKAFALLAVVVVLAALCVAGCSQPGGASNSKIEKKTYPLILQTDAKKSVEESEMNLYFVNGGDVPYVAVSEFLPFFGKLYEDEKLDLTARSTMPTPASTSTRPFWTSTPCTTARSSSSLSTGWCKHLCFE